MICGDVMAQDEWCRQLFKNEEIRQELICVALREEGRLIGYYEKHEYRNSETMKQYDLW